MHVFFFTRNELAGAGWISFLNEALKPFVDQLIFGGFGSGLLLNKLFLSWPRHLGEVGPDPVLGRAPAFGPTQREHYALR